MPDSTVRVLFVCTGNTCRSPLAQVIATSLAAERQMHDVQISSAGVAADDMSGASDGSLLVALERGLDLSTHRSRQLTHEDVSTADLVLTMSPSHLLAVQGMGGVGKAFLLSDYATRGASVRGVSDPIGGELDVYRSTFDELNLLIRRALDRLAADQTSRRN
jgi:protein-tyrosine phosphatase